MTSTYENIYSCFLSKVTDYNFVKLQQDDVYDLMKGWLHSAVSKPYIRRIFSSLILDDELMTVEFELVDATTDKYADIDYVTEIISKAMVVEWLEPQVKSVLTISQMFGGKEQQFFSQSSHLKEINSLLENTKLEIRKMIRDHGYFYRSYNAANEV